MIGSYIKIAFRRIVRERVNVLIGVLSLSVGIASLITVGLYLRSELLYDGHNRDKERIYRVITRISTADGESNFAMTGSGFGPLITGDYPQVGTYVRFRPVNPLGAGPVLLSYQQKERLWNNIYIADNSVFDVFTHKIVHGNPRNALESPQSIAISESVARYYFGDEMPIGKKIAGPLFSYAVTLVFADLPENTHFKYDALLPSSLDRLFDPDVTKTYASQLLAINTYTYLKVPPELSHTDLQSFADRFVADRITTSAANSKKSVRVDFQPLANQHFGEALERDQAKGNIFYLYAFGVVSVFILLIACINYMILATARASRRAKEIGMRQVLGATRAQLAIQFLGESFAVSTVSLFVGAILAWATLRITPISSLMSKASLLEAFVEPSVWLYILTLGVLVALLAGLYPALYLSRIPPLAALTQLRRSWQSLFSMRHVLLLVQLCISIAVIACTLLTNRQLQYVHGKPLGFDTKNRLVVTLRGYDVINNITTIKGELRRIPGVLEVSNISNVPGTGGAAAVLPVESNDGSFGAMDLDRMLVGMNFAKALNIKIVAGRSFDESMRSDATDAVVVNESLVKKMGWIDPVGKRIATGAPDKYSRVIGVAHDFNYASLHSRIGPLVISPLPDDVGRVMDAAKDLITMSIVVVLSDDNPQDLVRSVSKEIARFDPKFRFDSFFLEDRLNSLYQSETRLMKLTAILATTCILIAVFGLFGLMTFIVEERAKEISIRKVLGATGLQVVTLLARPLLLLTLIASILASFASYFAISEWLSRFAYRAPISVWMCVVASIGVGLVVLATVGLQCIRAIRANPMDALRHE